LEKESWAVFSEPACFYSPTGPVHFSKLAHAVSSPESLPSRPWYPMDPRVSLILSWVNTVMQIDRFAPVRLGKPVPFPLLIAAPPDGEILATPHAKVLRPSHRDMPHRIPSSCYAGRLLSRPLHHHDAGAKHLVTRPCIAPLLPPPLLAPRAGIT
jgi:hypothetical protein